VVGLIVGSTGAEAGIDREALVSRHNVVLTKFDGERPLQVGNGEFAFGMDATGLQTFAPFNTMSQWGWHTSALPAGQKVEDFEGQVWDTHGRPVRYPMEDPKRPELSAWMAANPHRINLGRIGLALTKKDGTPAQASDLVNPRQELDLWRGIVTSTFELEGDKVTVVTACHPTLDAIGVRITSSLVPQKRLRAYVSCPGNNPLQFANFVGDWSNPGKFVPLSAEAKRTDYVRTLDEDSYFMSVQMGRGHVVPPPPDVAALEIVKAEYGAADKWIDVTEKAREKVRSGRLVMRADNSLGEPIHGVVKTLRVTYLAAGKPVTVEARENEDIVVDAAPERSRVTLESLGGEELSFTAAFGPKKLPAELPSPNEVFSASQNGWKSYWSSGGAIDFSGSTDPRANELERRVVLSQYLMKVNEAGSLPPQESGLVNNGWFGRYHLEMVWWHAAHWAMWNRWNELDKSMHFYHDLLPGAQKLAESEGYKGARWPKCVGPDGREWPHPIHAWLIWQQPHPIFFAEMDYRAHPTNETLEKWAPIVEATADFLASYAFWDGKRYVLGPPVHLVSENTDPPVTINPSFELSYWRFGLRTAALWRSRMGLKASPEWEKVAKGLAGLPVEDGRYVTYEGVPDMWTKFNFEHPALTGTYGMLPGDGVDVPTMKRTLAQVKATWNWDRTWGWDYPMLAMCAARLGDGKSAVDFLLTDAAGFQFDERGLATGGPFPYFPSNGGLLYAVALMAKGWDGAPEGDAPGFPRDGSWVVRSEGLAVAP
jgi:hypothetical protein